MTDKEKIREEIEKKLEVMQYQVHRKDAYKELKTILDYIDSLQEEPIELKEVDLIIHTIITECCDWLTMCTDLSHDLIEDCRNLMLAVKDEQLKVQKGK